VEPRSVIDSKRRLECLRPAVFWVTRKDATVEASNPFAKALLFERGGLPVSTVHLIIGNIHDVPYAAQFREPLQSHRFAMQTRELPSTLKL
jgi:hypothetical protein